MNVIYQTNDSDTEAMVIMYGWVGATDKNLKKYADLYSNHDLHKCAVVYGTANIPSIMTRNEKVLASMVMDSVRVAVRIIRETEEGDNKNHNASSSLPATAGKKHDISEEEKKEEGQGMTMMGQKKRVPVVLHYFSNGGAFLAERLDLMIKEATAGNIKDERDAQDLIFIRDRLINGFEILDSAPAHIDDKVGYKVLNASVQFVPLRIVFQGLLAIAQTFYRASSFICQKDREEKVFWKNMINGDLCRRQIFVYSTKDELTDSEKLEEFIELRKGRGVEVKVLKFEDSDHVLHMRKYPDEYKRNTIDYALTNVCTKES